VPRRAAFRCCASPSQRSAITQRVIAGWGGPPTLTLRHEAFLSKSLKLLIYVSYSTINPPSRRAALSPTSPSRRAALSPTSPSRQRRPLASVALSQSCPLANVALSQSCPLANVALSQSCPRAGRYLLSARQRPFSLKISPSYQVPLIFYTEQCRSKYKPRFTALQSVKPRLRRNYQQQRFTALQRGKGCLAGHYAMMHSRNKRGQHKRPTNARGDAQTYETHNREPA
jgi:hypothetical protein